MIRRDAATGAYDYYGTVVNCAARVEAIGHGGQVLVTEDTLRLALRDAGVAYSPDRAGAAADGGAAAATGVAAPRVASSVFGLSDASGIRRAVETGAPSSKDFTPSGEAQVPPEFEWLDPTVTLGANLAAYAMRLIDPQLAVPSVAPVAPGTAPGYAPRPAPAKQDSQQQADGTVRASRSAPAGVLSISEPAFPQLPVSAAGVVGPSAAPAPADNRPLATTPALDRSGTLFREAPFLQRHPAPFLQLPPAPSQVASLPPAQQSGILSSFSWFVPSGGATTPNAARVPAASATDVMTAGLAGSLPAALSVAAVPPKARAPPLAATAEYLRHGIAGEGSYGSDVPAGETKGVTGSSLFKRLLVKIGLRTPPPPTPPWWRHRGRGDNVDGGRGPTRGGQHADLFGNRELRHDQRQRPEQSHHDAGLPGGGPQTPASLPHADAYMFPYHAMGCSLGFVALRAMPARIALIQLLPSHLSRRRFPPLKMTEGDDDDEGSEEEREAAAGGGIRTVTAPPSLEQQRVEPTVGQNLPPLLPPIPQSQSAIIEMVAPSPVLPSPAGLVGGMSPSTATAARSGGSAAMRPFKDHTGDPTKDTSTIVRVDALTQAAEGKLPPTSRVDVGSLSVSTPTANGAAGDHAFSAASGSAGSRSLSALTSPSADKTQSSRSSTHGDESDTTPTVGAAAEDARIRVPASHGLPPLGPNAEANAGDRAEEAHDIPPSTAVPSDSTALPQNEQPQGPAAAAAAAAASADISQTQRGGGGHRIQREQLSLYKSSGTVTHAVVDFVCDAITTLVSPLSAMRQLAIIRSLCGAWRAAPPLALIGPGPTGVESATAAKMSQGGGAAAGEQGGGDKDAAVPGPYIEALARRSAPVAARKWSSEAAAAVLAAVATDGASGDLTSPAGYASS
jgi:hypothetical protein